MPAMPCDQLVVSWQRDQEALVLALYGELDLVTAELLENELRQATEDRAARVVVDLSALQFIDSTGLRVLFGALGRMRRQQMSVSLLRGPRSVQRVFELTGTTELLPFED